ncbi:hypothetical protein WJX82_008810 [Trebouxia sp. C0006]
MQRRTRISDLSMGSRGAILLGTLAIIFVLTMSYFSTTMIDNRELHVAGVAGDVTGVRAATSLCELVQLGCLVVGLMAIVVVLYYKLAPSVRILRHPSRLQAARRRAVRRTFRRDAREASLIILGIASMAVILSGSATPPLHHTHPILSSKWGPSVHSSATTSPYSVHQVSHQALRLLDIFQGSPPFRDKAMQTAMAKTGESSNALAVPSDKVPTSKRMEYFELWAYSLREQSLQRWQPDLSLSAAGAQDPPSVIATASTADALVPSTQAAAKPGVSATVPAAKQLYLASADLTLEAAVARSASAIEQGQRSAAPLAPVLSTTQASSPEDLPTELEPVGSVTATLLPGKLIAEEAYPAVLQWFMGSILGQVVLGVFMLSLGGVILPGLCLWWEFGTIRPAVGAFIAPIEDQPEPMTLKMKNAGVDASKSLRRTSSLIKARVPVMAPALMPVITASVTNVQVMAGPELAATTGIQQASAKVQKPKGADSRVSTGIFVSNRAFDTVVRLHLAAEIWLSRRRTSEPSVKTTATLVELGYHWVGEPWC